MPGRYRDCVTECIASIVHRSFKLFYAAAYPEPCQAPKMEHFVKINNCTKPLAIFAKCSILDVWQSSQCAYIMDDIFKNKEWNLRSFLDEKGNGPQIFV